MATNSDGNAQPTAPEANAPEPGVSQNLQLAIKGQYAKDVSFSCPNASELILKAQQTPPEARINFDLRAEPLNDAEKTFEVILTLGVDAQIGGEPAFSVEVKYCGLCATAGLPDNVIQPVLFAEVPRMLFPFARAIIASVVREGGFNALYIQPIDFIALYKSRMEEAARAQQTQQAAGSDGDATTEDGNASRS